MMNRVEVAAAAADGRTVTHRAAWRLSLAARVFTLATALGLAVTTADLASLVTPFLILCALAAGMSLPRLGSKLWVIGPVAEGALVAMLLATAGVEATPLLAYLLVPSFVAGLRAGWLTAVLAATTECAATVAALMAQGHGSVLPETLESSSPWMLIGLGLGLLGAWVRAGAQPAQTEQERYESAHRLLARLHAVAPDLPQGLDAPSLAQRTLSYAVAPMTTGRSMLLIRDTADDSFRDLAVHGSARFEGAPAEDPVVDDCWRSRQLRRAELTGSPDGLSCRTVLPLRVGTRMLGVVVIDTAGPLAPAELQLAQSRLDEQGLRLDSAMLFEQVRFMATVEERHRLAREIHDGIAQEIASLGYLVDDLAASTGSAGADAARTLRSELSRIVSELRYSIFDLRMEVAQHGGLAQTLSDYARDIAARSGMTVHLALGEQGRRLPTDVETEMLRIAQEAITNARKHARASNLWVSLNTNGSLALLRVEDDGSGTPAPKKDHYGLQMMRERADRIGAELAITSRHHGGTSVVVALQPSNAITPGADRADLSSHR